MALNKQIYLYSVATDSFYEKEENTIHKELLKLYTLRKNLKDNKTREITEKANFQNDWEFWTKSINKIISDDKEKLEKLLNERLKDNRPRELNKDSLKDKNIITLFDSFLGEGACQKIFGNKDNYGQYALLMDALEPHFSKMELKLDKAKKKLASKYLQQNKDVI